MKSKAIILKSKEQIKKIILKILETFLITLRLSFNITTRAPAC